jgi:hypothetical protein
MITPENQDFVVKRRKLNRDWPRVGAILLIFWSAFGFYFLVDLPSLIDPVTILSDAFASGDWGEVRLMPVVVPVAFSLIWVLGFALLLNNASWVAIERKLLTIIADLQNPAKAKSRAPGLVLFFAVLVTFLVLFVWNDFSLI